MRRLSKPADKTSFIICDTKGLQMSDRQVTKADFQVMGSASIGYCEYSQKLLY
jgi:hypothetical protein